MDTDTIALDTEPKLKNNRPVLQWKLDAWKQGYVVLCYLGSDSYHPYVVWRADKEGNTYSGDYCTSLGDAIEAFKERR